MFPAARYPTLSPWHQPGSCRLYAERMDALILNAETLYAGNIKGLIRVGMNKYPVYADGHMDVEPIAVKATESAGFVPFDQGCVNIAVHAAFNHIGRGSELVFEHYSYHIKVEHIMALLLGGYQLPTCLEKLV